MPAFPKMDKLAVLNLALGKVPLPPKAALEDMDWNATQLFDVCVGQVLEAYEWNFAQTIVALNRSAQPPASGFRFSYDKPDDCVRVLSVRQHETLRAPQATFISPDKYIFCNISPCNLQYVRFMNDPAAWRPSFIDVVACKIAYEIAALAAQDANQATRLIQMYERALAIAQQIDATECRERVPLDFSIYYASGRGLGGKTRTE